MRPALALNRWPRAGDDHRRKCETPSTAQTGHHPAAFLKFSKQGSNNKPEYISNPSGFRCSRCQTPSPLELHQVMMRIAADVPDKILIRTSRPAFSYRPRRLQVPAGRVHTGCGDSQSSIAVVAEGPWQDAGETTRRTGRYAPSRSCWRTAPEVALAQNVSGDWSARPATSSATAISSGKINLGTNQISESASESADVTSPWRVRQRLDSTRCSRHHINVGSYQASRPLHQAGPFKPGVENAAAKEP